MAKARQVDYEIYSTEGRLIDKKSTVTSSMVDINASKYNRGIYILKVKQGNETKTYRLIKQ